MAMLKIYKQFLTKIYRPILFFDCGQKLFGLLPKKFRKVIKTSFYLSKETLEAVMFLKEIFTRIIFEVWSENFLMFVKILFIKVRWNFPKYFFFVFENSYQYCRNLKNNLRTFGGKKSPVFQISILQLKPFSWRKKAVRNCINFAFHTLVKIAWRTLGKRFPETFLESHCTSTLKKFEHIRSNRTIIVFVKIFRFSNKIFRSIDTKFSAVCQKCTKHVHGKN